MYSSCEHDEQLKGNDHHVKENDNIHQTDVSDVPINSCEVMLKPKDITEM